MSCFKKLFSCSKFVKSSDPPESRRPSENIFSSAKDRDQLRYSILLTGYNKAFEFPLEDITIDYESKISGSAFTIFYKGYIRSTTSVQGLPVSIKTLKENAELLFFKALVRELKILSSLSEHPNIVSLLGACTANIHLGQIYIVGEYCEHGTLENYLRSHRSGFVNKFLPASDEGESIYENFCGGALSTVDLLRWAIHVAKGMEFLSDNNLVHWELATRSVFLTAGLVAKVSDFHSLRRLEPGAECFVLTDNAPLPWKWMALESLKEKKFSTKSDVWTYGVTLWEIFSLGEDPYVGSVFGSEFISGLESGNRPYHHDYASKRLYQLMQECWNSESAVRPAFCDIVNRLTIDLTDLSIIPYS